MVRRRAESRGKNQLLPEVGVVIPVYLPEGKDRSCARALLAETARSYCAQVDHPEMVCLSVDGAAYGAEAASAIASACGTSITVAERNRGKLSAAANGVGALMHRGQSSYVAIVDQDGDHFANELGNLVRVAQHVQDQLADPRVMVLGQRFSRHRPLGFLRGELEALADLVLLDALTYRAARSGRPLRLEYALAYGECPDFHSGYKLFDQETAEAVFLGTPNQAGTSDICYYRHACEAVMTVEALESGAYLGLSRRSTLNGQPISVFGRFDARQLTADMITWPCKRLDVPLAFVDQWMANHAQQLLLHTFSPMGKGDLDEVRRLVVRSYAPDTEPKEWLKPEFV
jgi:hypothetical protein